MRLNMDCVRDILLCVEENTDLRRYCRFLDLHYESTAQYVSGEILEPADYQKALFEKYPNDVLAYHIRYCIDCDLIIECEGSSMYCIFISDLTPEGHDFLANIRTDTVWNKVKESSAKVGVDSLPVIIQIATATVKQLVKNQLGIT